MRRDRWIEILLIAVFAAAVCFQLFAPEPLGMADNGDYGRMIGRFALGPWHPDPSDQYVYLTTDWIFDRSYHWVSDNFSSELLPISGAALVGWFFNSYHFDIRVMGAVHVLLWIGCFAVLLFALRPMPGWSRWAAAIASLFVLTDASYIAFCNSFYMDTAAFLFLGWAVALWLLAAGRARPSLGLLGGFSIAAALSVMSKSQHAPLAIPLLALAVAAAFRFRGAKRIGALAMACIAPFAAIAEYAGMPAFDARSPQYGLVFWKILARSHNQPADAAELGLSPDYLAYVGRERPALSDPKAEDAWWDHFLEHASRGRVLAFYLRHPLRTAAMMYWDLKFRAPDRRIRILGKYSRESGYPPQTQARCFGWWTDLRSALFRIAPWHILVWFAASIGVSARLAMRRGSLQPLASLNLSLCAMAILEFAISSLSDASETERHLFLFQVLTDFTILCAIAWLSRTLAQRHLALPHPAHRNSAIRPSGPTAQTEPSEATLSAL